MTVSNTQTEDNLFCKFCKKEYKNKNSLIQHELRCRNNPNRLSNDTFKKYRETNGSWNKGLTKETDKRVFNFSKTLKKHYENSPGCFTGRHHSKETKDKISKSVKKYLEDNPEKVPYLLNHSSKESYPEKYFKELFKLENINLEYHKQIGLYQLDFCEPNLKIAIEIDGESHYTDKKTIEIDKRRTKYLNNLGWIIYRIRWSKFKKLTKEEKWKIINDIKNLISI